MQYVVTARCLLTPSGALKTAPEADILPNPSLITYVWIHGARSLNIDPE